MGLPLHTPAAHWVCPCLSPREPVAGLISQAEPSAVLSASTTDSATAAPRRSAPRTAPRSRAVPSAPRTALPERQKPFQHRPRGLRSPRALATLSLQLPGLSSPGSRRASARLGTRAILSRFSPFPESGARDTASPSPPRTKLKSGQSSEGKA